MLTYQEALSIQEEVHDENNSHYVLTHTDTFGPSSFTRPGAIFFVSVHKTGKQTPIAEYSSLSTWKRFGRPRFGRKESA